jgi:hypothetical protein
MLLRQWKLGSLQNLHPPCPIASPSRTGDVRSCHLVSRLVPSAICMAWRPATYKEHAMWFSGAAAADNWLSTWISVGLLWKLLWFYPHPHLIHVAALCSSFYTQNQSLRTDCTNSRCSSEMVVLYQNVCENAVVPLRWNLSLLTPTYNMPSAGHSQLCHTSALDRAAGKQQACIKCE